MIISTEQLASQGFGPKAALTREPERWPAKMDIIPLRESQDV
jgi:hypothetical protein